MTQSTIEQIIEVQKMTRQVEEETLKKAKKALEETTGTSVADTSDAVPQVAASEATGSSPVIRTSVSLPDKSVTRIPSEAATSEAAVSEVPKTSKVNQSPVPPTSPSSSSSTNTDSDLDDIPLSQKYNLTKPVPKAKRSVRTKTTTSKSKLSPKPKPFKEASFDVYQTIGELSEKRIGICNKLPANHPFQPPVIKPLNMLPPGVPIP